MNTEGRNTEDNYEDLYARIEWVLLHSDVSMAERRRHMHETLVQVCHEALRDIRQGFGSLFAQVDYLCRRHSMSVYDTIETHRMRRNTGAGRDDDAENAEQELLYDCRALAVFISAVSSCSIPSRLIGRIPPAGRQRKERQHIDYRHLRCIAVKTDEGVAVRLEEDSSERSLRFGEGQEMLHTMIYGGAAGGAGVMLSLVDVHEDADGALSARFIVLEPDYLLDISSVAACFTDYGRHPLAYLVNRMKPSANSQAIILGNYAGEVLDAALRGGTHDAEELWKSTLRQHFASDALTYATCPDFNHATYKQQCQQQAKNIIEIVEEIRREQRVQSKEERGKRMLAKMKDEDCQSSCQPVDSSSCQLNENNFILEPSFLCPMLGLQGRADLMTEDMRLLVEQKSGKNFNLERHIKNQHGAYQQEAHYVQVLLYFAVLHYNFNIPISQLDMRLMYSRYALPDGLLGISYYQQLLAEAVMVRNRIVASAMYFARGGFTQDMLRRLTPETLNERQLSNRFYTDYVRPELTRVLAPLHCLTPVEQAYFCRMTTFLHREQAVACLGAQEGVTRSMADIWNMPYESKRTHGDIIVCLPPEKTMPYVQDLTLRMAETGDWNFRGGDSIILYRYDAGATPDATRAILFRGTLASIAADSVTLHLSDPQTISADAADNQTQQHLWAIEHAATSTVGSGMKSLHLFACAHPERRSLLLCQREPAYDASVTLSRSYHPAYDDAILHACRAKDYFLIVGPPGTGKTSMAMRFLVQETLARMADDGSAILLTSYTNRAVDEICAMLTESSVGFLRIGSPYTCDSRYHDRLACRMFAQEGSLSAIRSRIDAARVVVATTSTLIAHQEILHLKRFSLTIVDEASQILETGLIGLLALVGKFVLIGDTKQLPAVVQQSEADAAIDDPLLASIGLASCRASLFERMVGYVSRNHHQQSEQPLMATLKYQGRMHPDIAQWPVSMFYREEALLPVPLPHQSAASVGYEVAPADSVDESLATQRMLFFDVMPSDSGQDCKTNVAEARQCADIVCRIRRMAADTWNPGKTVGVIVPYRAQISVIRQEIAQRIGDDDAAAITIDTVERYQGSQRDIIIYSFTVRQTHQLEFLTASTFLATPHGAEPYSVDRKLNVALTRARKQMIMIGCRHLLRRNALFRSLIDSVL